MEYQFTTEKFTGPLEKLLELIEAQKLGIDDVSLAKVTDGFLKYLDEFRKSGGENTAESAEALHVWRGDLRVLADFISIASRLILLKSKYLMPGLPLTDEEQSDIKDLEARLTRYRAIRPAIIVLAKLWRESHTSYSRPYFLGRGTGFSAGPSVFYPGTNVDAASLRDSLRRIFDAVVTYELETETIKDTIVSLEEKIKDVLARITAGGDTRLSDLSGEKSRADLVVVFLAILHLAREQLVRLEQTERFSDIIVRKNTISN